MISDFFGHWVVNSQARTINRVGAPTDFLYRFDLKPDDRLRFKLFLMVNTFFLAAEEVKHLQDLFQGSGATVVWFYAPGYIGPDRFEPKQMEALTGFSFKRIDEPGPMMVKCQIDDSGTKFYREFGVKKPHYPRFAVAQAEDQGIRIHGRWTDNNEIAFASKEHDGFTSIYAGTGPLPVEVLRWIAVKAGVTIWSSKPDNVRATKGAAMIVASDNGDRTVRFPQRMIPVEGGKARREHRLTMEFGEVRIFVRKT